MDGDTIRGGEGDDSIDGGSGYNTYEVEGTPDGFIYQATGGGRVVLTDLLVDPDDPENGSDQGTDTLVNIHAIRFVSPVDGSSITIPLDDYANTKDADNVQVGYGEIISGRINFSGDVDSFLIESLAGQKVVIESLLANHPNYHYVETDGFGRQQFYDNGQQRTYTQSDDGLTDLSITHSYANPGNSSTPQATQAYSIILRRVLEGTSEAETLTAGNDYEWLDGKGGADTLIGSARYDVIYGGDGNDVITGEAVMTALMATVAMPTWPSSAAMLRTIPLSGIRGVGDATGNWLPRLTITDTVSGRDGTDELYNIQILRFADGDVVLDAESNEPNTNGVKVGTAILGSLPITTDSREVDTDYFQQILTPDVGPETAIRISFEGDPAAAANGQIYFQFLAIGSNDPLKFTDLVNGDQYTTFYVSPNGRTSFIVQPTSFQSGSSFAAAFQRLDVKVWGYAYNSQAELGDLTDYAIRIDLVLFGDDSDNTIEGDPLYTYIDARGGNDTVTGSAANEEIVGGAGDDDLSGGGGDDVLVDSQGANILSGGDGNDIIDVSGTQSPNATIDGGEGTDTLRITSDTNGRIYRSLMLRL